MFLRLCTLIIFCSLSITALADDFVPADEDDVSISANTFTLDADNTGGNITLEFGAALGEALLWDDVNSRFSLSGSFDLQNNELINTRLENLAVAPMCDGTVTGKVYYNMVDNTSYNCNGTEWVDIAEDFTDEIIQTSQAFTDGLRIDLVANGGVEGGNAGKSPLFVLNTSDGKAQITSLEDGNECVAYLTGANFSAGTVLERVFLKKGEIYIFENLQNGSIVECSEGAYGFSGQRNGNNESPMPLGSLAFAFTDTYFFAFRNSQNTADNFGLVYVANGAVESTVSIRNAAGAVVDGQADVTLDPYGFHIFHTDGNQEYRIQATNPVVAGVNARMSAYTGGGSGSFYDSRLVMPLMTDGITWPRLGFMSALYNNTAVDFWVRDGVEGQMGTGSGISPGTPQDMDVGTGSGGTGASDQDYEPNGATRFKANGFVSGFSGADSSGLEATPMWPTKSFVQRAALPLAIRDSGDGGNNGIAIASPYEGTAEVYEWDPVLEEATLAYTVPLTRNIGGTTTRDDQNHPAAALVSANAAEATVEFVGDFYGGYVQADVPIHVVFNAEQNQNGATTVTRKGTSGAAVTAINADDDEQATTGITPNEFRNETREDANGILRKRVIDGTGAETWVIQ